MYTRCTARTVLTPIGRPAFFALAAFGALALLVASAPCAGAAGTVRVASGLRYPVFAASIPGDARLFVVEQRGVIKILQNGQILPQPFLDIDALVPDVSGSDERGCLGLAFDPDYAQNGRFYVDYINLQNNTAIARYQVSANPDSADPASAQIVLTITQPYTNHNGGNIAFGPDGYLYIGMGDGGSGGDPQNRAQDPTQLLGKMLRIDVSGASGYTVPPSNPFVGNPGYRPEIWALGLRNPYRWSFDRLTGDLWIGDVGQNLWEEVDYQPAGDPGGENYGWRLMEGDHCYNPPTNCDDGDPVLTYPILEYSHTYGCAITGGFVYRGDAIPALQGAYFYADWCSGRIWSVRYDGHTISDSTDHTAEFAPGGGLTIDHPAGFGEDGFGELYIVDRGSGTDGEVYRITPDAADTSSRPGAVRLAIQGLFPNPSRGSLSFQVLCGRSGPLRVEVIGPAGELVRTLFASQVGTGTRRLGWDGLDSTGRQAPSGVYFLRASLGGESSVQRISIVR